MRSSSVLVVGVMWCFVSVVFCEWCSAKFYYNRVWGSPVPKHKAKYRPPLTGVTWEYEWYPGGKYLIRFFPNGKSIGTMKSEYGTLFGTDYEGEWKLEGDILTIVDRPISREDKIARDQFGEIISPNYEYMWKIRLEPGRFRGVLLTQADRPIEFSPHR